MCLASPRTPAIASLQCLDLQARHKRTAVSGRRHFATATASAPLAAAEKKPKASQDVHVSDNPPTDVLYDAVIVGSGMGGLATATQMASKGAKVVVLEKCLSILYSSLPLYSSACPFSLIQTEFAQFE
jgi:heterodisulfide reductase subunit A-like polyferredoxin